MMEEQVIKMSAFNTGLRTFRVGDVVPIRGKLMLITNIDRYTLTLTDRLPADGDRPMATDAEPTK